MRARDADEAGWVVKEAIRRRGPRRRALLYIPAALRARRVCCCQQLQWQFPKNGRHQGNSAGVIRARRATAAAVKEALAYIGHGQDRRSAESPPIVITISSPFPSVASLRGTMNIFTAPRSNLWSRLSPLLTPLMRGWTKPRLSLSDTVKQAGAIRQLIHEARVSSDASRVVLYGFHNGGVFLSNQPRWSMKRWHPTSARPSWAMFPRLPAAASGSSIRSGMLKMPRMSHGVPLRFRTNVRARRSCPPEMWRRWNMGS